MVLPGRTLDRAGEMNFARVFVLLSLILIPPSALGADADEAGKLLLRGMQKFR
jgi:hypothetical protein